MNHMLWARTLAVPLVATLILAVFVVVSSPAAGTDTVEQVVFGRSCDSGPEHTVWFIDPDGQHPIALDQLPQAIGARLSPGGAATAEIGELLAVATPYGVIVVDYASPGSAPQPPIGPPPIPFGDEANLAWNDSGDLIRIARVVETNTGPAIQIPEEGGGPLATVVQLIDGELVSGLDWSQDGSTIAWAAGIDPAASAVYSVDVASKAVSVLGPGIHPRWSPDGSRIAFSIGGFLATMEPDGSEVDVLSQRGRMPVWSPDGTRLGFVNREEGVDHIGTVTIADGTVSRLFTETVECDDVLAVWDWSLAQTPTFTDVPFSHAFFTDIEEMAAMSVTKGCNPPANDQYCPDNSVTRGQMAAFLTRALGLTDRLDDPFIDDDVSMFEADIEKLAAAGITKGCNPTEGNTKFCPDSKVTREQMAAFLVRAMRYTDDGGSDLFVDDDDSIFEADIDRLRTAGVTKGCNPPTNDRFCPTGYVTRGQMAAFLHRALS